LSREQPRDEFIRKRIERQKRIRKRRLIIFFIFLIILLLCTGVILSLTVFFPIENINISGSKVYTATEIGKSDGIEKGDNLFTVSRSGIEKKLREELPYIETVEIKRQLPGTLNITVTDADEFSAYHFKGRYYTVSKSGWVLKRSKRQPKKLFTVTGAEVKCKVGTQIRFTDEKQKEFLTKLTHSLSKKNISVDYIDISDSTSLEVGVEGRFTVLLGTANDVEEKINHLSGMIENISKKKTGKINLSMWSSSDTKGTFVEGTPKKSSSE